MRKLISYILERIGFKNINISDPVMDEVIDGRITRRAVILALLEGRQR